MAEFIGLLLLAFTASVIAIVTPWFHARQDSAVVERFMLAELAAVALVGTGITGAALLVSAAFAAWQSHSMMQIGIVGAGLVIGLPLVVAIGRWIGRRMAPPATPVA